MSNGHPSGWTRDLHDRLTRLGRLVGAGRGDGPWRWLRVRARLSQPGWRWVIGLAGVLLVVLILRSLPYLAPIRAADLRQDDRAVEFRDRNGLLLGTLLSRDQNHTAVVPLNRISPLLLQAILAAEDQRFYQHGAIDLRALIRATAEAIQARQVVSGASTITMQLARMVEPTPRTIGGKLQEIWLSWRLVAGMSKAEILQAYLNRLPMGSNLYGVEAAARVYFGVPAQELTLAQASLLAALPNDPNRLNPYHGWAALKRRQSYVLERMVQDGSITPQQRQRAATEVVTLQPRQQGILAAPHFLFWQAQQLPPDHSAQIQTTLDLPLQQFVEAQVQQVIETLADHNVNQAAALVLDNHSGEVLAYVGSTDYFDPAHSGRNDGVQALRQPGSTLKPFLYQLALEKRLIAPNTILADVPTYYPIPGAQLYRPQDYSETFQGPVRVRIALANSLNVPAVRVLEKVGVATFLERLYYLGFRHLSQPPEYYGLGLALGSGEVSLWELAHAYARMTGQGQGVTRSSEADGLKADIPHATATWALIADMLSDRHARAQSFGVDSALSLPFAAAVKTGTSSDFRDTWTVGTTTDHTVATWVGNFNGEPMRQVSGVTGAAPLWNRIMLHLHEQHEPAALPAPLGLVQRPICALSGHRPTPACPTVVQEYFFPEDLRAYEQTSDPFFLPVAGAARGQPGRWPTAGRRPSRLNLPAEYNEWLALQPPAVQTSDQLRIVSPREGDYFVLAASPGQQPDRDHRLKLQLATAAPQPVEWRLNGRLLDAQARSALFWPLQSGDWTLEVRSGGMQDRVRFQVREAEEQAGRRGFSLVRSGKDAQPGE